MQFESIIIINLWPTSLILQGTLRFHKEMEDSDLRRWKSGSCLWIYKSGRIGNIAQSKAGRTGNVTMQGDGECIANWRITPDMAKVVTSGAKCLRVGQQCCQMSRRSSGAIAYRLAPVARLEIVAWRLVWKIDILTSVFRQV